MSSPSVRYLQFMELSQAALCLWGGYQSYIAITKLRKYEETTKKLAKWSNTVEEQLNKTRTTQGAGAIAILLSFIAAVSLATLDAYLPSLLRFAIAPLMLVIVLLARGHVKNFWDPKGKGSVGTRIPLPNMEDYNEAQRRTENVLETLQYLEYGWVATAFVTGMIGSSR